MKSYESHVLSGSDYYVYTPGALAKTLFFYPVCVGHFLYEPGYCLKRNSYDSFLIMYVKSGSVTVTIHDKRFHATKGDFVLIDCYRPHQYESEAGYESLWLHFDGPLARGYYDHLNRSFGTVLLPKNSASALRALSSIYETFRQGSPLVEASLSLDIAALLAELFYCSTKKETAANTPLPLSDIISYMNEHFAEPLSLKALSSRASLSPYYFTRLFTKETGMTPHQYLTAVRLSFAKFQLKTTGLSVKEIGFSAGFQSESSFCITFKKWEGITPSDYRLLDARQ